MQDVGRSRGDGRAGEAPSVRARPALPAAVAVAVLLLGGCTDGPASTPAPAPEVSLGLTQLLPEEGSGRALLRVINEEGHPVEVTAVGLDWPGYGRVLEETDGAKEVPGESELMLRLELPEASCSEDGEPPTEAVLGRLRVDGVDLVQPLTDPAQVYVQRLWRGQCDQQLLDESLRMVFADDPRQVTGDRGDAVATALLLSRRAGDEPVRLAATDGSVLYDLEPAGASRMDPGADRVRVPLRILPGNRCDEHAIGQATAPYDFSVTLRIGERHVLQGITPPLPVQEAASKMLLRHCGTPTE